MTTALLPPSRLPSPPKSWWTFRIYFFFCSGRGKGESEAPGGVGGSVFIGDPKRGGFSRTGGAEGPGGCPRRMGIFFGGGEAKYFFRCRNDTEMSTKKLMQAPVNHSRNMCDMQFNSRLWDNYLLYALVTRAGVLYFGPFPREPRQLKS